MLDIRTNKVEAPKQVRFADPSDEGNDNLTTISQYEGSVLIHSEDEGMESMLSKEEAIALIKALEYAIENDWWEV